MQALLYQDVTALAFANLNGVGFPNAFDAELSSVSSTLISGSRFDHFYPD
jgi:hypothetical protein